MKSFISVAVKEFDENLLTPDFCLDLPEISSLCETSSFD